VVFAAILHVTKSRWDGPIRTIAAAMGSFLPVSFVLILGLYFGREAIFPWIHDPVPGKADWLDPVRLFARDGMALAVLYTLSLLFLYFQLRYDLGGLVESRRGSARNPPIFLLTRGWRGIEAERLRSQRMLGILSPLILIAYA